YPNVWILLSSLELVTVPPLFRGYPDDVPQRRTKAEHSAFEGFSGSRVNDGYPFDLTQVAQLLGKLGEIRANGFGAAQRRERLARVISEVTGAPLDAA